jgi:multicomponent Na+:H+ antiporter subunit C
VPRKVGGVDPVVQALTLTDIVVAVAVFALVLALGIEIWKRSGTVDPDELREART